MARMNKSSLSVLVALSFIILKVNAKETCATVRVRAEYYQQPLLKSSIHEKTIISSSSFRSNYKQLATSASVSGKYKLFSAAAEGAYKHVANEVSKTTDSRHIEKSESKTFSSDFLQIVQKITREVNIDGSTAKTEIREIVDSIPKNNRLTRAQLWQLETDYIRKHFEISRHTFTERKCIPTDYEETGSIYLNGGIWGSWGAKETCKFPHFVTSMELKFEDCSNCDDTALNAIRLTCSDHTIISSRQGRWGDWRGKKTCSRGNYITKAQIRAESDQGRGDDTAANGLIFWCTRFGLAWYDQRRYKAFNGYWGKWRSAKSCPSGSAIMGLATKVENCSNCDDTALNSVEFYCAKIPPQL